MNIYLKLFLALSILHFMSCSEETLEIYKLDDFCSTEVQNGKLNITEVFIVANAPSDDARLKKIVEEFNQKTFDNDTLNKEPLTRTRTFYKQSKDLNRDFKSKNPNESGYFEKTDLSGYYQDKILLSRWSIAKKITGHNTWFLNSSRGETEQYVHDF